MKVQIVGLGVVGLPTAVHVSKFFDVVGFDVDVRAREKASGVVSVVSSLVEADVYVVVVGTTIGRDGVPDMSAVFDVCDKISRLRADALVCVESTVVVGTCRRVAEEFGLRRLVHCPHRYWSGDSENYGAVQLRVLGGLNEESLEEGKRFYSKSNVPVFSVSSLEVAELSKIAENSYRFVEISFAESLALVCRQLGLSFEDVREACNTLKRLEYGYQVQILEAREGIFGDCLPKDIRYLLTLMDSPLLRGAIQTDKQYKKG